MSVGLSRGDVRPFNRGRGSHRTARSGREADSLTGGVASGVAGSSFTRVARVQSHVHRGHGERGIAQGVEERKFRVVRNRHVLNLREFDRN